MIEHPDEYYITRYRGIEETSYKPCIWAREEAFDAFLHLEDEADKALQLPTAERMAWLAYRYPTWTARVGQTILNFMADPDVWVPRFMNLSSLEIQRDFIYNLIIDTAPHWWDKAAALPNSSFLEVE